MPHALPFSWLPIYKYIRIYHLVIRILNLHLLCQ
nr:MAG TPA: hypothetical protein [Caudoviricetes sp.]